MSIPLRKSALEAWVRDKIGLPGHRELTRKALTAYQIRKLRATIDYVKTRSPFYKRYLADRSAHAIRCPQDLADWPLIEARDLRQDPAAFLCVSQSALERVVTLRDMKNGTNPARLFFTAGDLELSVDFFHQSMAGLVTRRQRVLILLPGRLPHSVGDLLARALGRLEAIAYLDEVHDPEAALEIVSKHRIDSLIGAPTQVAAMARHARAAELVRGRLRSIWLGTREAPRAVIDEIAHRFGCPVFVHYGMAEMCPGAGVQCTAREGFHLREADLLIEIIDPQSGRPLADGRPGELVFTTLTRAGMPLVRYRTGVMAAIMTAPCPCGSVLRRLALAEGLYYNSPKPQFWKIAVKPVDVRTGF